MTFIFSLSKLKALSLSLLLTPLLVLQASAQENDPSASNAVEAASLGTANSSPNSLLQLPTGSFDLFGAKLGMNTAMLTSILSLQKAEWKTLMSAQAFSPCSPQRSKSDFFISLNQPAQPSSRLRFQCIQGVVSQMGWDSQFYPTDKISFNDTLNSLQNKYGTPSKTVQLPYHQLLIQWDRPSSFCTSACSSLEKIEARMKLSATDPFALIFMSIDLTDSGVSEKSTSSGSSTVPLSF